jgi:hypothetical protein
MGTGLANDPTRSSFRAHPVASAATAGLWKRVGKQFRRRQPSLCAGERAVLAVEPGQGVDASALRALLPVS